ncbi:hypothetical protein [Nonomuraea typhae]|uniref:Uncharacterized protein n=1 Tax=Nonomuraea typhae TaxID=2603600 RepID=A0ABW7YJU2_9ACTN
MTVNRDFDMCDQAHAGWVDHIAESGDDEFIGYVSPWYRALAAVLGHES